MRTLGVLFLVLAPQSAFAQDQPAPAVAVPPAASVVPEHSTPPLCSIPLLAGQIPQGIHFTMRQASPREGEVAAMPQGKPPAPSCVPPPPAKK